MTARAAADSEATESPGSRAAVSANDKVATARVMTSRFKSASLPPRHSQSSLTWVA